MKIVKVIWVNI